MRAVVPNTDKSIIPVILAAALVSAGTITLTYPQQYGPNSLVTQQKNKGHFFGCQGHKVVTQGAVYEYPRDFELTFNAVASGVTLTWRAATIPAATALKVQLNEASTGIRYDGKFGNNLANVSGAMKGEPGIIVINLTAPSTKSTTSIAAAQAVAAAGNLTLNGANTAIGGVVYQDVPRAVDIVSSNAGDTTQTATIYGTDVYGQAMRENIAFNGTTRVLGKKAFFTITRVAISAALAGNGSVGNLDILGLPVFLPVSGYIIKELENGVLATAGTTAAGAVLTPTATTADVRGTYLPNNACDGTKSLQLVVALNELSVGGAQYNG